MRKLCSIRNVTLLLPLVAGVAYAQSDAPVVLDKVVAVVNKSVILASDLDDEIRLSVLDASQIGQGVPTRERALEQLISRTLVEQQINEEAAVATQPTAEEVSARVDDLRRELPACVHSQCDTDAGWSAFLNTHGLTEQRVEAYLRYRLEILQFIENRFRQGIRISQEEIDSYYKQTLMPQFAAGEAVPPLNRVAPRIEEILLEQKVNALFDQWLDDLRQQGDVQILDPALESATAAAKPESAQ